MKESVRELLVEVDAHSNSWFFPSSRFYEEDCQGEIEYAESKGWMEVERGNDPTIGEYCDVTITVSGRHAIGAPTPKQTSIKDALLSKLQRYYRRFS